MAAQRGSFVMAGGRVFIMMCVPLAVGWFPVSSPPPCGALRVLLSNRGLAYSCQMRAFESIHFAAPTTPGARLIVTGAVHGNETCGTVAIRRVLDDIEH